MKKLFLFILTLTVLFASCKQEEIDIKNLSYKQLKKIHYEDIAVLGDTDLFLFDLSGETTIPLEITEESSGAINSFLKIHIDGKDYTFLLSTLSPKTFILESFFMNSGIRAIPTGENDQLIGFLPSVTLGNVEVRNIRADVLSTGLVPTGMGIDGIIGADFFKKIVRYNISFADRNIDLDPDLSDDMEELECQYSYNGFPVLELQLDGNKQNAIIATEELYSLQFDRSLQDSSADVTDYFTRTPYSHMLTSISPVPELSIELGELSEEALFYNLKENTYFSQLNQLFPVSGSQPHLLLGGNFWMKNDIMLSPTEWKCWIRPR